MIRCIPGLATRQYESVVVEGNSCAWRRVLLINARPDALCPPQKMQTKAKAATHVAGPTT